MRSDCEHMLAMGTEQGNRIGLLQEEVARMQEERKGSAAGEAKSLAGNLSKEISCLQEEYERACLSIRETNSQMESLQKDVIVLRSELERKENVIGELNERLAGSFENSPTARGPIGKEGVGAQGFGDGDEKHQVLPELWRKQGEALPDSPTRSVQVLTRPC